ncbi:MAG: PrsW family intramembrane metalloprotease [Patescibacteria group bacterium]|nr:PrsW family intramembrane metalloprotease [Patescibacteria group bacterium]
MDYWPLILGLIPSIAWLIFYLNEDKKPESLRVVFIAFLTGGITTFVVLLFQLFINKIYIQAGIQEHSAISFLILATLEESFKFLGVYYVISKRREFDEPVDAMVYMIAAALGFAAVENVAANFNVTLPVALETTTLRFLGATLLHTLSSGLVGYYWARSILANKKNILIFGIGLATLLHATFNYLIIRYEPIIIPTIFLITLAIFILHDFEKIQRT